MLDGRAGLAMDACPAGFMATARVRFTSPGRVPGRRAQCDSGSVPTSETDPTAGLRAYVDASPTSFHAAESAAGLLVDAGWSRLSELDAWPTAPGRYLLVRDGSLVAWNSTDAAGPATPFRIVGAHTDSPHLRVKPRPDLARAGWQLLGVEVYGGPLLNSWLDRDLGLAGRLALRDGSTRLVMIDEPLLRVAQLAIHLDRGVNTDGLVLNPQQHLAPLWALGDRPGDVVGTVAERAGVGPDEVLAFDLALFDTAGCRVIGRDRDLLAGPRFDNQATCYAGVQALLRAGSPASPQIPLLVLFDHEEVGSLSARGAWSSLLPTVLERIVLAAGGGREDLHRALAGTVIASGDMGHAIHPNYAERHEPQHPVLMNGGPVLKINNNLRYATDAPGAAAFIRACEQAGVPVQTFVTRSDLPCGSTVGPMTAALTGAVTVDFGAPLLSMHSIRELVGVVDQDRYARALEAFFSPA
jgi:aspartyl aminopeptidase